MTTTHLPQARWTRRDSLARLVAALGAEDIRWVGGCVRDTLLGHASNDIDAATRHLPVIDRCEAAGIRTIPTGIDHGTVTAIFDDGNVEITTLRRDVETDGRRATIAFSGEWKDDAARRDTINALYAHPATLAIDGFFGGLGDLAARRVRHRRCRNPHPRGPPADHRYFRFATRFGDDWDAEASAACAALAPTLKGLSRERVGWELQNLLALPDQHPLRRACANWVSCPKCCPNAAAARSTSSSSSRPKIALASRPTRCAASPRCCRRSFPSPKPLPPTCACRASNATGWSASLVAARRMAPSARLAYRVGADCALDRLLIARAPIRHPCGWRAPAFPLKGGEIVARGVAKGPEVARILQEVEALWVEERFPPRAGGRAARPGTGAQLNAGPAATVQAGALQRQGPRGCKKPTVK